MLNITFRKYHMKKKNPVTRAGYLSKNLTGAASLTRRNRFLRQEKKRWRGLDGESPSFRRKDQPEHWSSRGAEQDVAVFPKWHSRLHQRLQSASTRWSWRFGGSQAAIFGGLKWWWWWWWRVTALATPSCHRCGYFWERNKCGFRSLCELLTREKEINVLRERYLARAREQLFFAVNFIICLRWLFMIPSSVTTLLNCIDLPDFFIKCWWLTERMMNGVGVVELRMI